MTINIKNILWDNDLDCVSVQFQQLSCNGFRADNHLATATGDTIDWARGLIPASDYVNLGNKNTCDKLKLAHFENYAGAGGL